MEDTIKVSVVFKDDCKRKPNSIEASIELDFSHKHEGNGYYSGEVQFTGFGEDASEALEQLEMAIHPALIITNVLDIVVDWSEVERIDKEVAEWKRYNRYW